MASVIDILVAARDLTGPAFASTRSGLQLVTASAAQTSRGFAAVGAASTSTSAQMDVLSDKIRFQERQLDILGRTIDATRAKEGDHTLQIDRQSLAYDKLTANIQQNRVELDRLQREQAQGPSIAGGMTAGITGTTTATNGLALAMGGARSALGAFGIALGAREVVQFGMDTGRMANELEFTSVMLKQVTGSAGEYSRVLRLAGENQRLFGGSLNDNLEGLQGLALLARSTKTDIDLMNTAAQQLAIKDPTQGSTGAMVALSEILTGKGAESTRSLRMRYEILPDVLRQIERARDPSDKIKALTDGLTAQGITSDVLNSKLDTTAQKYRDLGIEAEKAKLIIGSGLSEAGAPGAEFATNFLRSIMGSNEDARRALGPLVPQSPTATSGFGGAGIPGNPLLNPRPNVRSFGTLANPIAVPQTDRGFAAPVINVNIASTVIEPQKITSLVQEGIREYERANGRPR